MPVADPGLLVDWAERLAEAAEHSVARRQNEEELRLDLNPVIVQAAQELYRMDSLSTTSERRGRRDTLRHYDNLYAGVAMEWEWSMGVGARREHGASQALEYLADLRSHVGSEKAFTAAVSDGRQWGLLIDDPVTESTLFGGPPTSSTARFEWRPNDPAVCRRFLELLGSNRQQPITGASLRTVFGSGATATRTLVALLIEGLAGRNPGDRADVLYREWRRALDVAYGDLDATSGQLVEAVAGAYNVRVDRPVGEYLFVLHTYFSLVARLFAAEILALATDDQGRRPTSWATLPATDLTARFVGLDQGDLPGGLSIGNLFESDVFGWWLDLCRGNFDLQDSVRGILSSLGGFAFPRAVHGPERTTDVLSDLYQSLVPAQLRRKLGEFLTPHWLAEACLHRLGTEGAPMEAGKVIDPTCGTGSFILPVLTERLAHLRRTVPAQEMTSQAIQAVLDGVVGIDINPVAVTATRVNYVLALGTLAQYGGLTLPVWRADSLLVPEAPARQGSLLDGDLVGRRFRELQTSLPEPFRVPPLLATASRMAALRQFMEEALGDPSARAGKEGLLDALGHRYAPTGAMPATEDDEEWANEQAVVGALYDQLRRLSDEGKNGIWAQIIANAYAPLFAGRFDVVVGNPPWLAWGRLPEAWRQGSVKLWRRYGLWRLPPEPGDTGGVLQVGDLAQLVYAVAVDRYATDGGYVGLLTPRAVLIADPGGRAFRRFRLLSDPAYEGEPLDQPFSVLTVDDWSDIHPFAPLAANQPTFIVSVKGASQTYPVPGQRWSRTEGAHLDGHWHEVRPRLTAISGEYRPARAEALTAAWSFRPQGAPEMLRGGNNHYNFGVGLHTRGANGVFFVRVTGAHILEGRVRIVNVPGEGRNPNVTASRGLVEASLVYPLLRGRDVSFWRADPSGFILVPHDPDHFDQVLSPSRLSAGGGYPSAGAWLRRFRDILGARHSPPNRNWDMAGEDWCRIEGPMSYLRGTHIVVVREIAGRPAAAVVERRYVPELGRSEGALPEHKLLFCSVPTLDEALYVTAFINSTPAQDFLVSFVNTVGITPRAIRTLPIPAFDPAVGDVATLVACGQRILSVRGDVRTAAIEAERPQVDAAVGRLGGLDSVTYQSQPIRGRRRAARPSQDQGLLGEVEPD